MWQARATSAASSSAAAARDRASPSSTATGSGPATRRLLLLVDPVDQLVDPAGPVQLRILLELQLRDELDPDLLAQGDPQVRTRRPQRRPRPLPRGLVAQDRVEHPGLAQVRGHPHTGHRDEADPGVLQPADLLGQDLPQLLGHPLQPLTHRRDSAGSARSRSAPPVRTGRRTWPPRAGPCGPGRTPRGDGDREGGALPQVLVVDLGHRDVELLADPGGQGLHHVALLLERRASGDAQVEPLQGHQHALDVPCAARLERAGDLADLVGLDDVALLDVLEVLQPDAALEPLGLLPDIKEGDVIETYEVREVARSL